MKNKIAAVEGKKKNNLILIIVLSSIFGLLSGLTGAIAAGSYFSDFFNFPAAAIETTEQNSIKQAGALIENAKKIISERDNKTKETANSAQNSLVGIFKKKNDPQNQSGEKGGEFKLADYYSLNDNIGQGLIITSDGWILAGDALLSQIGEDKISDYAAITREKKVYKLDGYKKTGVDSYVFLHLAGANNLPVKKFSPAGNLAIGQTLIAVNWQGESCPTTVVKKNYGEQMIKNSDFPELKISLSDNLENYLKSAFVFDLEDGVTGFFDSQKGLVSIDDLQPLISGLLEKKNNIPPSLGLTYSNLSEFAIRDASYEKGSLIIGDGKKPAIAPKSAAAGILKEGDLILSINNTSLDADHDLANLIKKYSAGDEIDIFYYRGGEEKAAKIKLGELK